jgi:hypothetical protein
MSGEIITPTKPVQAPRIRDYASFWPLYLREHAKPRTRLVHYFGTTLVLLSGLALLLMGDLIWLILAPVAGYAPAWYSHFFIEKNRPATFRYPLWSLYSDFRMYFFWLSGELQEELEWAGVAHEDP